MIKPIIKIWNYLFFNPQKEVEEIKSKLQEFVKEFKGINIKDGINNIVPFFQLFSTTGDEDPLSLHIEKIKKANWRGKYDQLLTDLNKINEYIGRGGRSMYGWNRTKVGETVTEDKVFLGDIYGLFTHPVKFWKSKKDDEKGGWGFSAIFGKDQSTVNSYDAVSMQTTSFINTYLPVIEKIEGLSFA